MTATLKLNLSDALTQDELRALLAKAAEERKSLERVIYEAALSAIRPTPPAPPTLAAMAAA